MKICPKCKAGTITLKPVLVVKSILNYPEQGEQVKVTAEDMAVVSCSACDLNVTGRLENATIGPDGTFTGGHFVEVRDVGKDQRPAS